MRRFHHVGIFVKNLIVGLEQLSKTLEIENISEVIADENLMVLIQFVTDSSGVKYELVAPFGDGNPVEQVLRSKKNILNHIAYVSDDFEDDIIEMRRNGAIPLGLPKEAKAFQGRRVVFFLTTTGFVYELIESAENAS
jgi:methylmalonyl-CoA/ethylmalonyl-CoA epimerase